MWNWYYHIDLPKSRVGRAFAIMENEKFMKNLQNCDSKIQTSASKT